MAVVHGGKHALKIVDQILNGEKKYHFVEIMRCSGGCVAGGGQPHIPGQFINEGRDIRLERAKALYEDDEQQVIRKSHENPAIQAVYEQYLGKPNSHKAHELLHTTYYKREVYDHE